MSKELDKKETKAAPKKAAYVVGEKAILKGSDIILPGSEVTKEDFKNFDELLKASRIVKGK